MMTRKHTKLRHSRRGMALLFVVSLILFITLLGASFVVVSQQFATSAKNRTRIQATGDSGRVLTERAFYDLVREPPLTNVDSPLRGHSILGDIYGYGLRGTVTAGSFVALPTGNGRIGFTLTGTVRILDGAAFPLSITDDVYNGLVLTFVTGDAKGTSVRIVDYDGTTNTFAIQPQWTDGAVNPFVAGGPTVDSRVIINGRAYFGWGAGGVNVGVNKLADAAMLPRRMADGLLPDGTPITTFPANSDIVGYASTGVHESYDALDFQNMYLAAWDDINGNGVVEPGEIIASFNRSNLFSYLDVNFPADDRKKYANFRPRTSTYSSAALPVNTANGWPNPTEPLDIDNDGDGIVDSIWMDLDYPIQTDIDGRRYKPLVAYLALDMDGRFNVNAHGDLFDLDPDNDTITNLATTGPNILLGNVDPLTVNLPHGQALGPPEITMAPLLPANGTPSAYQSLLFSRYGSLDPLNVGATPGKDALRDAWAMYEMFGHPDLFHPYGETYPNQFVGGLFGTSLDIHGRYSLGIPHVPAANIPRGLPALDSLTGLIPEDEIRDSAYEFSLIPQSRYAQLLADISDDNPFEPQEVERILRQYDRDAKMLPDRLDNLIGASIPSAARYLLTSESWDVPSIPGLDPVAALGEGPESPVSLTQRIFNLLTNAGLPPAAANAQIAELLSQDVRMGLPFDINQPFGNGRDDNGNGVVDEHWGLGATADEASGGEAIADVRGTPPFPAIPLDNNGDGALVAANEHRARYEFAKQLYVLALLATGDTINVATPPLISIQGMDRRTAVAQWAINVVDFRDPDSIMTPFEFDMDPFDADGWAADGDPNVQEPKTRLVWGTERPELLFTEAVAGHDMRTEDLASVGPGQVPMDPNMDQRLVPNPSVFFELYNPWALSVDNQRIPQEFGVDGVNLAAVAPPGDPNGDPVWRIVVAPGNFINQDVPTPNQQLRRVYFIGTTAAERARLQAIDPDFPTLTGANKVYFPSESVVAEILPGEYGVVGSASGPLVMDSDNNPGTFEIDLGRQWQFPAGPAGSFYRTTYGRRNTATWNTVLEFEDQTRQIGIDSAAGSVRVVDVDAAGTATVLPFRPAVCIPIGLNNPGSPIARSLGISETVAGYYNYRQPVGIEVDYEIDGYRFVTPKDNPSDTLPDLAQQGTRVNHSVAYLQRLANPLEAWNPLPPNPRHDPLRQVNPFMTIDSISIDLQTYNGADNIPFSLAGIDPILFAANERGRHENDTLASVPADSNENRERLNIWEFEPQTDPGDLNTFNQRPGSATDNHYFGYQLTESVGTVNDAHIKFLTDNGALPVAPLGYSGLPWLNRPFASQFELLEVPYSDSFSLLRDYTIQTQVPAPNDPYDQALSQSDGGQFGHLINFYYPAVAGPVTFPTGLSRLLDFTRVPSRFAGNHIHLTDYGASGLYPPFNELSRFREPGRINVNTMFDDRIWQGLLGEHAIAVSANGEFLNATPTTYNSLPVSKIAFEDSRRKGALPSPALFDNPIRNAADFDKVPTAGLVQGNPSNTTLLRQDELTMQPLFEVNADFPFADPDRNALMKHYALQRLGNTATTRSNVFAIWITVGRFEVDMNDELTGLELGADVGKTQRHRAFYMIDRTKPAAFEPGQNHNVENIILSETYIK